MLPFSLSFFLPNPGGGVLCAVGACIPVQEVTPKIILRAQINHFAGGKAEKICRFCPPPCSQGKTWEKKLFFWRIERLQAKRFQMPLSCQKRVTTLHHVPHLYAVLYNFLLSHLCKRPLRQYTHLICAQRRGVKGTFQPRFQGVKP